MMETLEKIPSLKTYGIGHSYLIVLIYCVLSVYLITWKYFPTAIRASKLAK
jgi:hypothetical protein